MNNKKDFCIRGKNSVSVNILRSWLRAVDIRSKPSTDTGFDLVVDRREGGELRVAVVAQDSLVPSGDGIVVEAKSFTGKKVKTAMDAFYRITDAAGYDRRQPLKRDLKVELNEKGNPRKLCYTHEAFLVAIRWNETMRSPNPPEDRWTLYKPIIEKVSWRFYVMNEVLCRQNGWGVEDIMQCARMYLINFCARTETPTPVHFDNERLFSAALRQRFASDLFPSLIKSLRSQTPDCESVRLALFSTTGDMEISSDPTDVYIHVLDNLESLEAARKAVNSDTNTLIPEIFDSVESVDFDYIARNCILDTSSIEARKASAGAALSKMLLSMPHDKMVEILTDATKNERIDLTARKEAHKRLRHHTSKCSLCKDGFEESEELAGEDAVSVQE